VNRSALPAIFNPEDLHAVELALDARQRYGGRVTVVSMGPPQAANVLRESLFRGADDAILVTDRRAAASDTLATSYILSCAIRKLGDVDVVCCGRQAIDGDTAQVGPQCAEKLGFPQVTYVEEPITLEDRTLRARRSVGNGYEVVECPLPCLLTVTDRANEPRYPAMRRMARYKRARTPSEIGNELAKGMPDASDDQRKQEAETRTAELSERGLLLKQWDLDQINADLAWCGRDGSPTKVHRIQSVVVATTEQKKVEPTQDGINDLVHELIEDHTIG
jgi:electron transfer flavoprotein beta subunit